MRIRLVAYALIVLLGIATYFNSLSGAFIWDDNSFIRYNDAVRSLSHAGDIFFHNIAYKGPGNYIYYRPLQELTYLLDYHFWSFEPSGYHLSNIFLHILVAIGIFLLVHLLTADFFLSFLTVILFIVHPVHTETVSYIAGRGDSLAAAFIILTLIVYIKNLEKRTLLNLLLIGLLTTLSLFSKENAIMLPLLIWAYHFCYRKKFDFLAALPVAAGLISYFLFRILLVHSPLDVLKNLGGLSERLPGFFYALSQYFKLLLWPFDLHFDYGQPVFSWQNPTVLLGLLIFVGLLIIAFSLKRRQPIISFSIFWFFISLLPYSNILTLFNFMAEHFLYLASIGFFLCLAMLLKFFYQRFEPKLFVQVSLCLLIVGWGSLTILQNVYWLDPVLFYQRTIQYNPNSYGAYTNLGVEYYRRGQPQKELEMYHKALEIKPDHAIALKNLGLALLDQDQLDKAEEYLKQAKLISPDLPQTYNGLGVLAQKRGDLEVAIKNFEEAIHIKNTYRDAYINLANLYKAHKKYNKAIETYERLKHINPSPDLDILIHQTKTLNHEDL